MEFFVFSSPEYSYCILQGLPMPFEYILKKRTQTNHWRNKRHLALLKRKAGVCCMFSLLLLDLGLDLIYFPVMWVVTECEKIFTNYRKGTKDLFVSEEKGIRLLLHTVNRSFTYFLHIVNSGVDSMLLYL